jgi:hypothetical protein
MAIKDWARTQAKAALTRVLLSRYGLELVPRREGFPVDFDPAVLETIRLVRGYTLTSDEAVFALVRTVEHVVANNIPGALVECGVWKGGSVMAMAHTLLRLGDQSRDLYLFDTFEGMTQPTAEDRDFRGRSAEERLERNPDAWVYAPLEAVREAVLAVGYPPERIHFVKGRVEDTLPAQAPESIAVLRLDTDWYESTRHELEHLYTRVAPGGILIIDDYGHWQGSRQATDEFIAAHHLPLFLSRIDNWARLAIVPPHVPQP